MNKTKLKSYAPQARLDFIDAVKARAALLGIAESGVAPANRKGDVVIVEGREWPALIGAQRERLVGKIAKEGFEALMDRVAYTWFNRFAALRYMELHDYLGHGYRVLSSSEGAIPEIVAHAHEVDLPGLDRDKIIELRLAGNRDGDLYRMVLVAQCNALSVGMPFLFERIDDESELLLPDNLLRTDSVIAKMVSTIDEEDWKEVEIIGWLYQFYISERKAQVMGKVVKSADIPAATQLFTPNWIVKYLVQNSVGRLWLQADPSSLLQAEWEYYVEPAEQAPEVLSELTALIAARVDQDGGRLNPESITVLDPACGSGHILVEVYEVLKNAYLERGYQLRAIPRLILEKNIFGVDIDERAAQLTAFALVMKARADDRKLFSEPVALNIAFLRDTKGLPVDELASHLAPTGEIRSAIARLLAEFEPTGYVGSLISPSSELISALPGLVDAIEQGLNSGDVFARAAASDLAPILRQAAILSSKFDVVVANPPYMGGKGMNAELKAFATSNHPLAKTDLYAMFIDRAFSLLKPSGFNSMVTMQGWMFASSFEEFRERILATKTLVTMAQFGSRAFSEISGDVVQTAAFSAFGSHLGEYRPTFFRLVDGAEEDKKSGLLAQQRKFDGALQQDFSRIPGSPVAYWASPLLLQTFTGRSIGSIARFCAGMSTGDNPTFQRLWHEVPLSNISFDCRGNNETVLHRWYPCNSGGTFRKWYGNNEVVVDWQHNGARIKRHKGSAVRNPETYFKKGLTYSKISSGRFAARYKEEGYVYDDTGRAVVCEDQADLMPLLGLLCSNVAHGYLTVLAPLMSFTSTELARIPLVSFGKEVVGANVERLVAIAKADWDDAETSWGFGRHPLVPAVAGTYVLEESWREYDQRARDRRRVTKALEEENNLLLSKAYGLCDEVSAVVSDDQITLTTAERETDCRSLVSYALGCMMGRYSLDEPGLVYADAGNAGFDPSRYKTFPADADGIVPITDELWFQDEAAARISEFVKVVWGSARHEENMVWLAESLGVKNGETPEESVRRYLATTFYKDHLQIYTKRPIYWLFTSGKRGAFQALVYVHRYHEGTLSRMRSEYVVPLLSKYLDRIEILQRDIEAVTSAAARAKIQKRIDGLRKQHHELVGFEERLRHLADSRIRLDLNEGVKANYGRFGDLLAETRAITGGSDE